MTTQVGYYMATFRVAELSAGDLAQHLDTAAQKGTYTYKMIQNEIINLCGNSNLFSLLCSFLHFIL